MSNLDKGIVKFEWMTVFIEATLFVGMIITRRIYPQEHLFKVFTVLFISIAFIFLILCAFLIRQSIDLNKKKNDENQ